MKYLCSCKWEGVHYCVYMGKKKKKSVEIVFEGYWHRLGTPLRLWSLLCPC